MTDSILAAKVLSSLGGLKTKETCVIEFIGKVCKPSHGRKTELFCCIMIISSYHHLAPVLSPVFRNVSCNCVNT